MLHIKKLNNSKFNQYYQMFNYFDQDTYSQKSNHAEMYEDIIDIDFHVRNTDNRVSFVVSGGALRSLSTKETNQKIKERKKLQRPKLNQIQ